MRCRRLVLGVGSRPSFPECCNASRHSYLRTANYLDSKDELQRKRSITVVGSGQSAAEVYFDLLQEAGLHDYSQGWLTRSSRFFQMETTKLTLEMFSPDYIDYFYRLDDHRKESIVREQSCLYKGVNACLIDRIYELLDERRNQDRLRTHLISNCELERCRYDADFDEYEIGFRQMDCGTHYLHRCQGLVFATGYRENIPAFIDGIRDRLHWDGKGRYRLARNYAADVNGNEIFVQNPGQHTHGMTGQASLDL